MRSTEVAVPTLDGPGLLRLKDGELAARAGVVALHGASYPERDQPLFEHLARTVTPLGYAVLTYDRRPSADGGDTPLDVQAVDALAAVAWLREEIGAPAGLYGFSQGAWAAALAASRSAQVAFLAVVGCCGVSPAVQMRYYTDELLRRAGYGEADRALLRAARLATEAVLRGEGDRDHTAELLGEAATRPWFPMAYLPSEPHPPDARWPDMDYDPEPAFAAVSCPALLLYGADEECVPAEESKAAWLRAAQVSGNTDLTITDLDGCGHFPASSTPEDGQYDVSDISPVYTDTLLSWFASLANRTA
jgi:hypothetical protein